MTWDLQETYLNGLADDEDIPFSVNRAAADPGEATPGMQGPTVREGVDTGADVLDLTAFIREMEANPDARRRR
jgi:hypothetical protein